MPDAETVARSPRNRLRLSIGAAVALGLVALSAAVGLGIMRGQATPSETVAITADGGGAEPGVDVVGEELYVHVLGQVARPGLYLLDPGARVVDAIAAAGGTLDEADLQAVNLARSVTDGEQLLVPAIGEVTQGAAGGGAPGIDADGTIDLNTADEAALDTLPRIGPALAQRIIQWREENGRFQSVDDLLAVSGIGEKLLSGIRDQVRV